jgi:hypothetical protein
MSVSALAASRLASPTVLGVGAARPAFFKSLSNASIAALTAQQIGAMKFVEMAALSGSQIKAFNPQALATGLPTYLNNKQVLPTHFIASLGNNQISQFGAALVSATLSKMSISQIGAISTSAISGISTAALQSLSGAQLSGFTRAQLGQLSTSQVASLRSYQISATPAAWLNKLSGAQLQSIGAASIAALHPEQIKGLDTDHIRYLSGPSTINSVFPKLSTSQISTVNASAVTAISLDTLKKLSNYQLKAFTVDQFSHFTSANNNWLVKSKFNIGFTAQQMNAILSVIVHTYLATKTGNAVGAARLSAGDLVINGKAIGGAASASAKDVAAAINLQTAATGVTATANATTAPAAAIAVAAASVAAPMPGEVSVTVSPPMVSESGSDNLTYTFIRGGDISNALTVNIGIGGTSTATDYTSTSLVPTVDNSVAWSRFTGSESISSLATASDGTVIAVGMTSGPLDGQLNPGGTDAFIIKYATDGTKMWTRLLGSSGLEVARAAATGPDGSAYIVGYTDGSFDDQSNSFGGRTESFVSKFDSNGTKLWTRLFGGLAEDYAHTVTVGQDGEIYVGGVTNGSIDDAINGGRADSFITKFLPDGTKQWTRLDGKSVGDYGYAMTAGLDGGIYLTGLEAGIPPMNNAGYIPRDTFITKYTSAGAVQWSTTVGSGNESRAIATGLDGSIYVGGWTNVSFDGQTKTNDGEYDGWVCKYSPNGTKLWTRMVGGLTKDGVFSLTAGLDGAIYVGGNTATVGSVTKMMPDGTKVWTKIIGGTQESQGGITTGLDGAIYFASTGNMTDTTTGATSSGGFISKLPLSQPTITFPSGSAAITLTVNPVTDNLPEGSETLSLSVLSGSGYSTDAPTATATGVISDGTVYPFGAVASGDIQINSVNIGAIASAASNSERQLQMVTAINARKGDTGVAATVDANTGGVKLTALDGRNIEISTLTSASIASGAVGISLDGLPSGNRTVTTYRSSISLRSTSSLGITIKITGTAAAATGLINETVAPTVIDANRGAN